MNAVTALQLEKVRIDHEARQLIIQQQGRWITAMLVVMLTVVGGVAVSTAAGQMPPLAGGALATAPAAVAIWLASRLRALPGETWANAQKARREIDRLIIEEGEGTDDGQGTDA